MHKKIFPASLNHLHEMLNFIHDFAIKQGFESTSSDKIVLAAEEALVNVIHHSYPEETGEVEICCEESMTQPGMKILIKDFGIPFDPVQEMQKKRLRPLTIVEETEEGGYGILIYVGLMDRVEYYRTEEGNLLFLIKYL